MNGHPWLNDGLMRRYENGLRARGLAASWYYDGNEMHDPLFVDHGDLFSTWTSGGGKIRVRGESDYSFDALSTPYNVNFARADSGVRIQISPWTDFLSRVTETGKTYFRHLGYKMHKIRGSKVHGHLRVGDKSETVEGTAYFQKVRINSPTSPWYWGIFHSENGSYIDYFMPHIGPPALRRTTSHRSIWDWGEKMLSKGWQFYDASTGRMHHIKRVRIKRRYEGDLPVFTLVAEGGGEWAEMEMESYARAYWEVRQPFLRVLNNVLYYNEYPVNVTEFFLKSATEEIQLEDLGRVVGNCEHAWGLV